MKLGESYVTSREKRAFDVAGASLLWPLQEGGKHVTKYLLNRSGFHDVQPIFEQKRIGQNRLPFIIHKLATHTDQIAQQPYGVWAETMRRLGLDELAQSQDILAGKMSIVGPRPLIVEEYEETRDALTLKARGEWDRVIEIAKPGLISSYGIYSHKLDPGTQDNPIVRAMYDIEDFKNASIMHDLSLISHFIGTAIGRRLK